MYKRQEFGPFDRDNMYRYEFAGYLNLSNDMLDDVLAHPDRATVRELVAAGREHARTAERAFRQWDYLTCLLYTSRCV